MADRLELFKIAATAFLALGVAAVVESRLVPSSAEAVMSRSGRERWSLVEVFVSAITIVAIVAGEALCIRVLTTEHMYTQNALISNSKGEVKILLWIAAGSIVAQALGRQALVSAWKKQSSGHSAELDNQRLLRMVLSAVAGSAVGLGTLLNLAVLGHTPAFLKIKVGPLALLIGGGLIFVGITVWQKQASR